MTRRRWIATVGGDEGCGKAGREEEGRGSNPGDGGLGFGSLSVRKMAGCVWWYRFRHGVV